MDFWRFAIRQQFRAAIDRLANAIEACPEPVVRPGARRVLVPGLSRPDSIRLHRLVSPNSSPRLSRPSASTERTNCSAA